MTSGMEGGMTGPMVDEAAVMAAENFHSYPLSFMAFISIMPSPAASATAAPDMPEKIMLAMTLTWPRPPQMCPTRARAKRNIRSVIPPVFIRLPARMKNGMASSVNDVVDAYMRWATMVRISAWPMEMKVNTAVRPMATATGTPRRISPISTQKINSVVIDIPLSIHKGTRPPQLRQRVSAPGE